MHLKDIACWISSLIKIAVCLLRFKIVKENKSKNKSKTSSSFRQINIETGRNLYVSDETYMYQYSGHKMILDVMFSCLSSHKPKVQVSYLIICSPSFVRLFVRPSSCLSVKCSHYWHLYWKLQATFNRSILIGRGF